MSKSIHFFKKHTGSNMLAQVSANGTLNLNNLKFNTIWITF